MKALAILMLSAIVASFAFADEAEQQTELDQQTWASDMQFLGPNFDLVHQHWIDGCQVTIELNQPFEATDTGCQRFGDLVRYIFESNPSVCLIYVLPDEFGWVPSAENPIDYAWALCLSDETYCPMSSQSEMSTAATISDPDPFDNLPLYPSRPVPVVVRASNDGGGCFIQTTKP